MMVMVMGTRCERESGLFALFVRKCLLPASANILGLQPVAVSAMIERAAIEEQEMGTLIMDFELLHQINSLRNGLQAI